jgi:hypothetical protein
VGILGDEGLPVKGSVEYYIALAHRDRIIQGRHLAASSDQLFPLTFSGGNDTYRIPFLGQYDPFKPVPEFFIPFFFIYFFIFGLF